MVINPFFDWRSDHRPHIPDNEQVKSMATQVKNDLDALGFNVSIVSDTSPATYAAIDAVDGSWDILLAPGDPSCFGADVDLLLNWWYGIHLLPGKGLYRWYFSSGARLD